MSEKGTKTSKEEEISDEYTKTVADLHKTPVQKYAFPQTSAQEYGWIHEPLVDHRQTKWHKPQIQSEITGYVEQLASNKIEVQRDKSPAKKL
eukprot:TRINITY_DN1135_c0_g1_i1.p2 TRINITY_DN1135_c0_g1~~TRINITY_DN1135_c0_g1_i1.p2  ORF type:complete len:92 (+),score=9.90 TRINITY_DN1135_c0_g1_i1:249-524(+)